MTTTTTKKEWMLQHTSTILLSAMMHGDWNNIDNIVTRVERVASKLYDLIAATEYKETQHLRNSEQSRERYQSALQKIAVAWPCSTVESMQRVARDALAGFLR